MATYIYLPANKLTHTGTPVPKGGRGRNLTHGSTFVADFDGLADCLAAINARIPGEGGLPAIRAVVSDVAAPAPVAEAKPIRKRRKPKAAK